MPPEKPTVFAIAAFDSVFGTRARVCAASIPLSRQAQGVRHRMSTHRPGVTLLELIVVLALMGLMLAIAAPAFITPRAAGESGLTGVVATARRAAVLRAEPVTVVIEATGAWAIEGDATPNARPIATGTLAEPVGQLRVRVSPLGTCVPDRAIGGTTSTWDALDCRLESTVAEGMRR